MTFTITMEELKAFEDATDHWLQERLAYALNLDEHGCRIVGLAHDFEISRHHTMSQSRSQEQVKDFMNSSERAKAWEKLHPRPQLVPGRGPFPTTVPEVRKTVRL